MAEVRTPSKYKTRIVMLVARPALPGLTQNSNNTLQMGTRLLTTSFPFNHNW